MRGGFTLIELLVVVTIIVVLLALLTPALDKAIYQAELAVCGASLNAAGGGALTYAAANQRSYPHRAISGNHPRVFGAGMDYRPMLRDYVGINGAFNDPLSEPVDYTDTTAGVHGYAARSVWFGYRFDGGAAMRRLGQTWTWTDRWRPDGQERIYHFDVLIGDLDFLTDNLTQTWGSHPDGDGLMAQETWQNQAAPAHPLLPVDGVNRFTMSRWWIGGTSTTRGRVDLNFAHADGSISRFDNVTYFDTTRGAETTRLRGVGWNPNDQFSEAIRCSVPMSN